MTNLQEPINKKVQIIQLELSHVSSKIFRRGRKEGQGVRGMDIRSGIVIREVLPELRRSEPGADSSSVFWTFVDI